MAKTPHAPASGHPQAGSGFERLSASDLIDTILRRRSRRFGLGMSIPEGPLAHRSRSEPVPLTDTEEQILLATVCGVVGWHEGIPHRQGDAQLSSYSMRFGGRAAPSGGGVGTGELIYTNDSGTYIVRTRDIEPVAPGLDKRERLQAVMAQIQRATQQLLPHRVEVPRQPPHYSEHNLWNANVPGSTVFFPIIDTAQYLLAFMAMQIQNGGVFFDERAGRPCGELDPFIRSGLLDPARRVPLMETEKYALALSAMDGTLMCQNIVLAEQLMGLGGWLFTGINPTSLLGGVPGTTSSGLGFRCQRRDGWLMPNPVGIDGVYEAWVPPYVDDMHAAARRMAEHKFGPHGAYAEESPGPYPPGVRGSATRYSTAFVDCLGTVAQYVYDAYGKFPATLPTIFTRPYAQAHHLDLDWYEAHLGPHSYLDAHRTHFQDWH